MTRSAVEMLHSWPTGRLTCALVVVVLAVLAAVPAVGPAQTPPATADNPRLQARCGLKAMLVLDESESIYETPGALDATREAAHGFVDALDGTGSPLAIAAFESFGRRGVPSDVGYVEIDETTRVPFHDWIDNRDQPAGSRGYSPPTNYSTLNLGAGNPFGTTNWEDGFDVIGRIPQTPRDQPPDLVVFVTDGDPNTVIAPGRLGVALTASGRRYLGDDDVRATDAAVIAANELKAEGSRIFAIGVGSAVQNAASRARLARISGDRAGLNPVTDDYTVVDFDEMEAALRELVVRLCGGTLTVTKYERAANASAWQRAEGWRFTATLSSDARHRWLVPDEGRTPSASLTTDSDGQAVFTWQFDPEASAELSVRERVRRGWRHVFSSCMRHSPDDEVRRTRQSTRQPIAEPMTVEPGEWVTCRVFNRQRVAGLRVVKRLRPSDDPGRFDLFVERSRALPADATPRRARVGDGGRTRRLALPLGTYSVWEDAAQGTEPPTTLADYSISTRCVNNATGQEVASGVGTPSDPVSVRLRRETDDIVCTITNRRPGPPTPPPPTPPPPPEGITPPPPCLDFEADVPVCADLAAAPNLVVTKQMPARARVGDRVPITITVQNVGRQTAQRVRLHETPPGGGRIARVAQGGSIRRDRTAVWNLGNLAAGARRTVRATMLVTRTGLQTNTAVAAAENARPDFDVAAVRARAARRPPSVTG